MQGVRHDRISVQWNAVCVGVRHECSIQADPKVWQEVREGLSKAAEPDLRADDQFWSEYDGSVAEVANMVNDTYLKANGQKQGVKSYGKMTDLLVAYDQSL